MIIGDHMLLEEPRGSEFKQLHVILPNFCLFVNSLLIEKNYDKHVGVVVRNVIQSNLVIILDVK